jgi:UDP-GlcNAc3NAcA epimerase
MKTAVRLVGARPQYMQVLGLQTQLEQAGVNQVLVHTGQHYDPLLADRIIAELGLPVPKFNLQVGSKSHAQMTAQIMTRFEELLLELRPDFVIVDGDTNSTLGAALTAAKMRIPLVHLEAGVRDFDRNRPEEINRILTDHCADLNFSPVPRAQTNLQSEGLGERSHLAGDFLLDNFITFEAKADHAFADALKMGQEFNLITLHRPENTDGENSVRFFEILDFIASMEMPAVFPVHPRTTALVNQYRASRPGSDKIRFVEPLTYLQMLALLQRANVVFTDSGGLSREAVWSGKKTLMFFRVDTWHDLLEHGWAQIAKGDLDSIEASYAKLKSPSASEARKLFGSGRAAESAVRVLKESSWI